MQKQEASNSKIVNHHQQTMYKTKVLDLCHKKSWGLPDYVTIRNGPAHNPSFISIITVNDLQFRTFEPTQSVEEAKELAAELAFHHFSQLFDLEPMLDLSLYRPQLPNLPGCTFPQPSFSLSPHLTTSSVSLGPDNGGDDSDLSHPRSNKGFQTSQITTTMIEVNQKGSNVVMKHEAPLISQMSQNKALLEPNNLVASEKSIVKQQPQQEQESPNSTIIKDQVLSAMCNPILPESRGNTKNDKNLPTNYLTHLYSEDMQHLYKNQLQNYAHKRNLSMPVYSCELEGPPHNFRFKSKVTIDGKTFGSPKFFTKLKDAEHAAAEVALMSLLSGGDQTGLYKNLLQELVQKEGLRLPSYNTNKYGEAHMPIFVSQVEIQGEKFTGQEAKSKKQAEMSAAKVAYLTMKDRKGVF
ncbi:hypothetical protein RIF29_21589 [Crotalaria pallida]|uniref:DRBM domain-containing protein n=1 Tax=Crotalaria pallida TaxID=3830 RepID=A0AAN9F5K8_CROPI